jgi:hypothetical protein
MSRRSRLLAASTTLFLIGGVAWWTLGPDEPQLRQVFPGEQLTYDLTYAGLSSVRLPDGSQMTAELSIAGDLELSGRTQEDDTTVLTARFVDVDDAWLRIGGRELRPELMGQSVTVALDGTGALTTLYFSPDTPVLTQQVMQSILLDLQVVDGGGSTWSADTRDTNGELDALWVREDNVLERVQARYSSFTGFPDDLLTGHAVEAGLRASLTGDGLVSELTGETHLWMEDRADIRSTLRSRLVRRETHTAPDATEERARLTRLDARTPDAVPGRELAEHNALVGRVGGLTRDLLFERLARGVPESDHSFAWQATGLLRLHPELADELAQLHASGSLGVDSENLLVDLLANAGNPASQRALCDIVARPDVQASDRFGRTVQSIVLTPEPTAETTRFLMDQAASLTGPNARLARNAAAITASRIAESGDPSLARALGAETVAQLTRTDDPRTQAELLLVVGNLRQADHIDVVLTFTDAEEPRVRASAARALRDLDAPDARAELIRLTEDDDSYVQVQALRSLDATTMTDADYTDLAERIANGAVRDGAEEWLLRLAEADPRGRQLLTAMLERGVESDVLRNRMAAAL